jgi:hypothetical protein
MIFKKTKLIPFLIIILLILIINTSNFAYGQVNNPKSFKLLLGSSIYIRIFLFYFPISKDYNAFISYQESNFSLDITINKENIKIEPDTPSFFDSNLTFHIMEIPYNTSGQIKIPISIQCNQKFIKKKALLTIYQKDDILIIKGTINNLFVNEITDNEYFKNRFNWKYPVYFDLRMQKER